MECYDRTHNDYRHLVTGATGKLTVRGMNIDTVALELRLVHESYVSALEFDRRIDLASDRRESSHTLVMDHAGSIRGRVTEAESGEPDFAYAGPRSSRISAVGAPPSALRFLAGASAFMAFSFSSI